MCLNLKNTTITNSHLYALWNKLRVTNYLYLFKEKSVFKDDLDYLKLNLFGKLKRYYLILKQMALS